MTDHQPASATEKELASRFSQYSKHQDQFKKAINAASWGCVKKHVFLPSGRYIYTVVGRNGDEFVDPDKPFCSCESYFYVVQSAKAEYCYHIISCKIASESRLVEEIEFDDEEYDTFMRLLVSDVLNARGLRKT